MMVLLPNKRDGLQALEAHLKNNTLSDLSWRTSADDPVEVQLPRFKMEEDINLKVVLSAVSSSRGHLLVSKRSKRTRGHFAV